MASLLPNAKQQFINPATGLPLAGGLVYYYVPNTKTAKATYQDQAQTIPNTNPITLDSNGECIAWGTGAYRQQLYDSLGNLIWDQTTADVSQSTQTALPVNLISCSQSALVISATLPAPPAAISSWYQVALVAPAASVAGAQLILPNAPSPWNTALPIYFNGIAVTANQWAANDALYLTWNSVESAWDLTTIGSRSFLTQIQEQLNAGTNPASLTTLTTSGNATINGSLGVVQNLTVDGNAAVTGTLSASPAATSTEAVILSQVLAGASVTDVTANRAINTNGASGTSYTNSTGRPLIALVTVQTTAPASTYTASAYSNGVESSQIMFNVGGGGVTSASFLSTLAIVVMPGKTYYVTQQNTTWTLVKWVEVV